MIRILRFNDLFVSDLGWLKSRFHFSFAEYRNPDNLNFGVLRVLNDDLVQPRQGFGRHPHQDMEIISYVVAGGLTHQDSMQNKETLGRGDIQYLSAGTGITHSEMNEGEETCRFLQIWIFPEQKDLTPNYGSKRFLESERLNQWLHLVGPREEIAVCQDVNLYVTELTAGKSIRFPLAAGRQAYLKLIEGQALLNGAAMRHGDAAEIIAEEIDLRTEPGAHLLLIEMAREGV